jgi:hypothetical protein
MNSDRQDREFHTRFLSDQPTTRLRHNHIASFGQTQQWSSYSEVKRGCSNPELPENWTVSARIQWTDSSGLSGQLGPDSVDSFVRIGWTAWAGLRSQR